MSEFVRSGLYAVPPTKVESREGRGHPVLRVCFTIVLLLLIVTVAGTTGDGSSGGEPANFRPERAETGEGAEGGGPAESSGPNLEGRKLLEGKKAKVAAAEALVAETVMHLSRSYPSELLPEAARENLLALRPRLQEALEVLEDLRRFRSLTEEELRLYHAFKTLLAYSR